MGMSTSDGLYTTDQFKQPFLGGCPLQLQPPGSAPTAGEGSPLPLPPTPIPAGRYKSSATPLTVACQASLSMEFSRQEYWSGLSFPPPEDLPDPRIKPMSLALAEGLFTMPGESQGRGSLVGCCLWGHTDSDMTEAT